MKKLLFILCASFSLHVFADDEWQVLNDTDSEIKLQVAMVKGDNWDLNHNPYDSPGTVSAKSYSLGVHVHSNFTATVDDRYSIKVDGEIAGYIDRDPGTTSDAWKLLDANGNFIGDIYHDDSDVCISYDPDGEGRNHPGGLGRLFDC